MTEDDIDRINRLEAEKWKLAAEVIRLEAVLKEATNLVMALAHLDGRPGRAFPSQDLCNAAHAFLAKQGVQP